MGQFTDRFKGYSVGVQELRLETGTNGHSSQQTLAMPPSTSHRDESSAVRLGQAVAKWTPMLFMISYLVFSIAVYTIMSDYVQMIFWFLYVVMSTLLAITTLLEAYDGLTPVRNSRKAISKMSAADAKWKVDDAELPFVDLVFDLADPATAYDAPAMIERCIQGLLYPSEKVRASLLLSGLGTQHFDLRLSGYKNQTSLVSLAQVPAYASHSLSARVGYLLGQRSSNYSITALYTGSQLPHPHAVRHACERFSQDAKLDVVQGRNVYVPRSSGASPFAAVACLENDMFQGLLNPGRAITWGLHVPNNTNAYWRTDALRDAAASTARVTSDGTDLPFAALRNDATTAYDPKIITHEPCPSSIFQLWAKNAAMYRQWAQAVPRYTTVAFRHAFSKVDEAKKKAWPLKTRVGVFYFLPITCLAAHARLQFFCYALALLFTKTPHSAADVAELIHYKLAMSQWMIYLG